MGNMFISSHEREPCILVGGPLDGKIDKISTIGPNAPCDVKYYEHNKQMISYRRKLSKKKIEKRKGRWVLYFEELF